LALTISACSYTVTMDVSDPQALRVHSKGSKFTVVHLDNSSMTYVDTQGTSSKLLENFLSTTKAAASKAAESIRWRINTGETQETEYINVND